MLSISADTASSELLTRMKGFLREIFQLKMLLGKWMSVHLQPLAAGEQSLEVGPAPWTHHVPQPVPGEVLWYGRTRCPDGSGGCWLSGPILNTGNTPCGLDVELQSQSAWRCTFHQSAEIRKHLKALAWSDLMWFNFLFKGSSFFLLLPCPAHTGDRLIVGVFSLSYTIKHHGAIVAVNWCCLNKTELNWSSYCEELLKLTLFLNFCFHVHK